MSFLQISLSLIFVMVVFSPFKILAQDGQDKIQVFAHYTNWYSDLDDWRQVSTFPYRNEVLGRIGYRSDNPDIIRQHNQELIDSGIVPLISWWGRNSTAGDGFLDRYFTIPSDLKMGLLYEATGLLIRSSDGSLDFNDPENIHLFVRDLEHLNNKYVKRYPERFYRIDGKPLLFIWISHAFQGPFFLALEEAKRRTNFYIISSDFNVGPSFRQEVKDIIKGVDAVSAYGIYSPPLAIEHMTDDGKGHINDSYVDRYVLSSILWSDWIKSNLPGTSLILPLQFAYDDFVIRGNPKLTSTKEEAQKIANATRDLIIQSHLNYDNIIPYVIFVSYNEHFEGTAIEPSAQYGTDFLEIIKNTFKEYTLPERR